MRPMLARFTSAVTAVALCSSLTLPAFAQQDAAKLEQAKKHMEAGASFYNDPSGHKCEEAFREFKTAFDLSGSLNALKGMGVCGLELERDGEAINAYEKYIQGKGAAIDPADKTQMDSDLNALKSAVAWVKLSSDRNDVKLSDVRTPSRGFPITNRYSVGNAGLKLGLHPGSHVITATVDGQPDQVWKIEIQNGGKYDHAFTFDAGKPIVADGFKPDDLNTKKDATEPTSDKGGDRPVPTVVFIAGGATIVLGGVMAAMMVVAKGKKSTYDADNGHAPATQLTDERQKVTSANLLADIFLGATVVGAVATTVLYVTRPTKPAAAPATGSWTVTPTVGLAGGGAALVGTF